MNKRLIIFIPLILSGCASKPVFVWDISILIISTLIFTIGFMNGAYLIMKYSKLFSQN